MHPKDEQMTKTRPCLCVTQLLAADQYGHLVRGTHSANGGGPQGKADGQCIQATSACC